MTDAAEDGLVVEGLRVEYPTANGLVLGADGVSLRVRPGERLGLVGKSGSGKTTTALAILQMIRRPGRIAGGRVRLNGTDMRALQGEVLRQSRLRLASYIPQGAMNSLNPVLTVAAQLRDALADHGGPRDRRAADALVAEALAGVDLPPQTVSRFPHELSGGMKQRVCIAIGMLLRPALIVADEPTSALDVVTQRQVMGTLGRLQAETGSCLILIGHDMGLMAQFVDQLAVMYAGRVVEAGPVAAMFRAPRHPYTRLLIELGAAVRAARRVRDAAGNGAVAGAVAAGLQLCAAMRVRDGGVPAGAPRDRRRDRARPRAGMPLGSGRACRR